MNKLLKSFLPGVIIAAFCILALGSTPALAHDGSAGSDLNPIVFSDFNTQSFDHNPDDDPWKGWWTVTVKNNTNAAWGDFHFALYDIPGQPSSNVVFCDAGNTLCQDPSSTQSPMTWAIGNTGKTMDLFYYSDPVQVGSLATFHVYTDNTDNHNPFGITMYPTVVPEPVSSALFVAGGITLGFRRFKKTKSQP